MEVVQMEDKTPSWLSIITKAKRFNVHANNSNNGPTTPGDGGFSPASCWDHQRPAPGVGHPKKIRRHRIPSIKNKNDLGEEEESFPPRKVRINFVDLPSTASTSASSSSGCSSVSSSPSPGLLSCGSSAEEESTSTSILSPFSSTSSSPKHHPCASMMELMPQSSYQNNLFYKDEGCSILHPGDGNNYSKTRRYPHNHNHSFHDFRERVPEISISPLPLPQPPRISGSNQISVIKSTRSILRGTSGRQVEVCDDDCCIVEEPQDLSIKPKRFVASTGHATNPYPKPNELFSHRHDLNLNDDEDNCVQDLSFRSDSINKAIPTITIIPASSTRPIIANPQHSLKNNLSRDVQELPQQQDQPIWKVLKLSSLISSWSEPSKNNSPSKLKLEKSDDSVSSSISTISLSSNSSHPNNLNSVSSPSAFVKDDDDEGDLVIVDEEADKNKNVFDTKHDTGDSYKYRSSEKLPVKVDATVKSNEKIHDVDNNEPSPTKETYAETDLEVEVEVKSRRGRKRKDEEAIGTRFDCFLCSFTGVKENVLRNHMIRMHTVKGNRGNVKCTVCGYSCPTVEELRTHQELIHMQASNNGGKSSSEVVKVAFHACHHCTKKFRSQSQLDAHLRLIAQKQLWKDLKTRRMLN